MSETRSQPATRATAEPPQGRRGIRARQLLVIFVVALAARGGWGAVRFVRQSDPAALEFPDEEQYWSMGCSLWAGEGLQDELGFRATRMPLYPGFLALFAGLPHGMVLARVAHWILGALVAVLTAGLGAAMGGRGVGIAAGILVAFDPFLIFFSSLLLTETPAGLALVGLWWVLWPVLPRGSAFFSIGRWVAVGVLTAACVYTRESSLGLGCLALLLAIIVRRLERSTVLGAMVAVTIVVVALLPWAFRNHQLLGEWCWLTTRGGISLYDGVRPGAGGGSDLGGVKQGDAVRGLDEAAWNHHFMRESIAAIRAEPARILRLAGVKLARTWNPVPNVGTYQSRGARLVSAGWTIPTFALAVGGLVGLTIIDRRDGLRRALFLVLPAGYVSVLHLLFVGSVRYRLPALPMLHVLAALALVVMVGRAQRRRGRPG